MEKWEERLLQRTREIIEHGRGDLTVSVGRQKQEGRRLVIKAGESWLYIVGPDGKELDKPTGDVVEEK